MTVTWCRCLLSSAAASSSSSSNTAFTANFYPVHQKIPLHGKWLPAKLVHKIPGVNISPFLMTFSFDFIQWYVVFFLLLLMLVYVNNLLLVLDVTLSEAFITMLLCSWTLQWMIFQRRQIILEDLGFKIIGHQISIHRKKQVVNHTGYCSFACFPIMSHWSERLLITIFILSFSWNACDHTSIFMCVRGSWRTWERTHANSTLIRHKINLYYLINNIFTFNLMSFQNALCFR